MVTAVILLLIGFSRVYLGVHFPTDVIAGWTAGIAILWLYTVFQPGIESWIMSRNHAVQLLLVLTVPLVMLLMHRGVVAVYQAGLLLGIGTGALVKSRFLSFSSRSSKQRAVARYVLGTIILIASLSLLRMIHFHQAEGGYLAKGFFHSACNGIWISLGAPWLFRLLKL
jgi:hypothetical protein